jgi:DNA primase
MRYPPSLLDDIRARLPVSVVVGRRVKLTRAGREWKGLSPFNQEKTPSFFVNDQKGSFFDFSSGRNGDIFKFVMETEGLTFPEAVEKLAAEAGVELPKMTAEAEVIERQRKGLGEAMELAAQFFEQHLRENSGRVARDYLKGRDLPADVIRTFRIGYAPPDRFALRDFLAAKDVPSEVMIEAGLLISGADIAVPYDRFRDRIMFPIADGKGRIIAFGGRALQKDAQAKYLNSPETPLFHKGATLYNIHRARKAAHDKGRLVAVEGYIDVIAMTRAGIAEAVAPLGTALTEEQLALMWRIAAEPILCFDGDKAGVKAAHRAVDVALPHLQPGKTLRFVFLPGGQDPDELLRGSGPEAVVQAVSRQSPFVDVLFDREMQREPLDTPEHKADLEKRLRELVGQIRDDSVRRHYREAIDERLRVLFRQRTGSASNRSAGNRAGAPASTNRRGGRFQPGPPTPKSHVAISSRLAQTAVFAGPAVASPREIALVVASVHQPLIVERQAELFASLELASRPLSRLRQIVLEAAAGHEHPTAEDLRQSVIAAGAEELLRRAEANLNPGDSWALTGADPYAALDKWLDAAHLQQRETILPKEMREAGEKVVLHEDESAWDELSGLVLRREVF